MRSTASISTRFYRSASATESNRRVGASGCRRRCDETENMHEIKYNLGGVLCCLSYAIGTDLVSYSIFCPISDGMSLIYRKRVFSKTGFAPM